MIVSHNNSLGRIDLFSPGVLMGFFFVYFFVIPFIVFVQKGGTVHPVVLISGILGIISYYIGLLHRKSLKVTISSFQPSFVWEYMFWTIVVYDLFFGFIGITSFSRTGDYTSVFDISHHDSLYYRIISLSFWYFKFILFSYYIFRSKKVFVVAFLSQVFIYFPVPIRLVALSPIIIYGVFAYYSGVFRVKNSHVVLSIPILLLSLPILLVLRTGVSPGSFFSSAWSVVTQMSWTRFLEGAYVGLESFQSFNYFVKIVENNLVSPENGIPRNVFLPISRSVWEDKPEAISRLISSTFNYDQYINGGGSVATIWGDGFINGHVFGVVIVLFIFGFLSAVLHNTLKVKLRDGSVQQIGPVVMLYCLFLFQFIYSVRGFFSENLWQFPLLLIVFFITLRFRRIRIGSQDL